MRVLFVGEGVHDVGRDAESQGEPAGGVVQTLVRGLHPHVAADSPARHWKDMPRFRVGPSRGLTSKLKAAVLLAQRTYRCAAIVAVVDRDHDDSRVADLHAACQSAHHDALPVVGGVAVNSIEAWTLGAPTALATVLGTTVDKLTRHYQPARVERLYQNSDDAAKRPKDLLDHLAQTHAHRAADLSFRREVAALTDPVELARHCPEGFAPFAASLRQHLQSA